MSVFEAGVDEGAMVENDRRSLERLKQLQVKEIEIVKWPDQSDKNHKFFIPRKVSRPSFRGGFWILRIQGPPVDEATWGDTKKPRERILQLQTILFKMLTFLKISDCFSAVVMKHTVKRRGAWYSENHSQDQARIKIKKKKGRPHKRSRRILIQQKESRFES